MEELPLVMKAEPIKAFAIPAPKEPELKKAWETKVALRGALGMRAAVKIGGE